MSTYSILSYTEEAFKSAYSMQHLQEFMYGPVTTGSIHLPLAQTLVRELNRRTQQVAPNIIFNPEMLTPKSTQLSGGSCSALALRVAATTLQVIEELETKPALSTPVKAMLLSHRLRDCVAHLHQTTTGGKKTHEEERQALRTLQFAYNTITIVDRSSPHTEQDKIKALASHFNLTVTASSSALQSTDNASLDTQVAEQLTQLQPGVYLQRILQHTHNHKLEIQGHSITYIKAYDTEFYFDPMLGLYHLLHEAQQRHLLTAALSSALSRFGVDSVRFHALGTYAFSTASDIENPHDLLSVVSLSQPHDGE